MKKIINSTLLLFLLIFMSCTAPDEIDLNSVFELSLITPKNGDIISVGQNINFKVKVLKYNFENDPLESFVYGDVVIPIDAITPAGTDGDYRIYEYQYPVESAGDAVVSFYVKSKDSKSNEVSVSLKLNSTPEVKLSVTDNENICLSKTTEFKIEFTELTDAEDGALSEDNIESFKIDGVEKTGNVSSNTFAHKMNLNDYALGEHKVYYRVTDNNQGTTEGEVTFNLKMYNTELYIDENFDSLKAFIPTTELNHWKMINYNQNPNKGSFNEIYIPNSSDMSDGTPGVNKSFFIMDPDSVRMINENGALTSIGAAQAHSGSKFLISLYEFAPAANNDWLYTPVVKINSGDKFEFWAKAYSADYPENFKVFAITNGSVSQDTSNPLHTGESIEIGITSWKKFSFNLTKFAGQEIRLAINHCSYDKFAFMIDDISIVDAKGRMKFNNNFEDHVFESSENSSKEFKKIIK